MGTSSLRVRRVCSPAMILFLGMFLIAVCVVLLLPQMHSLLVYRVNEARPLSTQAARLLNASKSFTYNAHPADSCHFISADPQSTTPWNFNSRALCMSSSLCFRRRDVRWVYLQSSKKGPTKCVLDTPAFEADTSFDFDKFSLGQCAAAQKTFVTCAHGYGLLRTQRDGEKVCPEQGDLAEVNEKHASWIEDISVVVPDIPFSGNIYHHSYTVNMAVAVAEALPKLVARWGVGNVHAPGGKGPYFAASKARIKKVNIVFRGERVIFPWQKKLLDIMIAQRLEKRLGWKITLKYLWEEGGAPSYEEVRGKKVLGKPTPSKNKRTGHVCIRNAVLIGRRGHHNLWPFLNNTAVPTDGSVVPADAVSLRRDAYNAFAISARLPSGHARSVADLPPLVLGYSRRLSRLDFPGAQGQNLSWTVRRFSKKDESWFTEMLRHEAGAAGAKLHVFTTLENEPLSEQVRTAQKIGLLVGIHGANLVNGIFMNPFGALLELFPGDSFTRCYYAGANSGLAYYKYLLSETASMKESGCHPRCLSPLVRLVKISNEKDRRAVRKLVRDALQYLRSLHQKFPNGIPVTYERQSNFYRIRT